MKATIKKINDLVYPEAKALIDYEPNEVNLEMLLSAIRQKYFDYFIDTVLVRDNDFFIKIELFEGFSWQLNRTLTEQSEKTQQTIKNLFE